MQISTDCRISEAAPISLFDSLKCDIYIRADAGLFLSLNIALQTFLFEKDPNYGAVNKRQNVLSGTYVRGKTVAADSTRRLLTMNFSAIKTRYIIKYHKKSFKDEAGHRLKYVKNKNAPYFFSNSYNK